MPQLQFDTSCLFSTVKNTVGQRRTFGFLPPHGRTLEIDEEFTVFGHITEAINRFERVTDKRQRDAFASALTRGDMVIVSTPNPVLQDEVTSASKIIILSSGSLAVSDPCWTQSISH